MRKILLISILTCLVLTVTSCYGFAVVRKDGPYEGRVIDVDTGEPIEGVVVLGVWYKQNAGPGGAVSEYYDAMETLTDKKGEFKINGLGLLIVSNIIPMDVLIFKAGYEYESGLWSALKKYAKKIKWEENKAIIPLKKLTMEERKKELGPPSPPHEAPKGKIRLMLKEINKDRAEQGLGPIDVGR